MLRYGAMQIDVFPLLTDARQRIAANAAAVDALRDFWLAQRQLGGDCCRRRFRDGRWRRIHSAADVACRGHQ